MALKKLEDDTATHRYHLRGVPIRVEQSLDRGQEIGGIEEIGGGEHGGNVTVMDAGVLHDCRNIEIDLAWTHKLQNTPPADGPSFNRLAVA